MASPVGVGTVTVEDFTTPHGQAGQVKGQWGRLLFFARPAINNEE